MRGKMPISLQLYHRDEKLIVGDIFQTSDAEAASPGVG